MAVFKNKIVRDDLKHIFEAFGHPDAFRDKTVLITGCAGFLGFYFCHFFAFLEQQGLGPRRVLLLDNFLLGKPQWLSDLENGSKMMDVASFDIARDDISVLKEINRVDYVIHMASIASPVFYRRYPLETLDANIWGLRKLLDHSCGRQVKGSCSFPAARSTETLCRTQSRPGRTTAGMSVASGRGRVMTRPSVSGNAVLCLCANAEGPRPRSAAF